MLKRITNFLTSLKFGIILFIIIAVYSIIGTVIPQGMDLQFYLNQYHTFGSLMVFLQFDRVYSSVIYLAIVLVFVINLVGCTLKILPVQLKKMKDYIIHLKRKVFPNKIFHRSLPSILTWKVSLNNLQKNGMAAMLSAA